MKKKKIKEEKENLIEQLLDLGHNIGVADEVLDIIINSKNIDDLLILQNGLNKMSNRMVQHVYQK